MNENLTSAIGGAAEEQEPELDELDIEAFAGFECKPRAKRYIVRIDKKPYVIEQSVVTARELLQIAGKNPPEKFRIWQIIRGESHELTLDERGRRSRPRRREVPDSLSHSNGRLKCVANFSFRLRTCASSTASACPGRPSSRARNGGRSFTSTHFPTATTTRR